MHCALPPANGLYLASHDDGCLPCADTFWTAAGDPFDTFYMSIPFPSNVPETFATNISAAIVSLQVCHI
jgi:hypothetical protein